MLEFAALELATLVLSASDIVGVGVMGGFEVVGVGVGDSGWFTAWADSMVEGRRSRGV